MPSIIFCDGFDTYTTILDKWDAVAVGGGSVTPAILAGSGRGGAGALYVANASPSIAQPVAELVDKNVGAQTMLYVGFAFKWAPSGMTSDNSVIQFLDGPTVQVALNITSSGIFYFTRGGVDGGTVIGTAAASAFPTNSFHYVEVAVTISGTVGVCQLKVDQTTVLNLTGLNTKNSTNTYFGTVSVGAQSKVNATSFAAYYDDVYFDTAGFNGDVRVAGLLPTGNGSTQNFSNVEASWAASTVTNLQTTIIDSNGNLQRCTAITGDFKTGGSAPTWNVTLGASTTDNHVTWTNLGSVSQYKLVNETDPDGDSSYIQSNTVNDISRFTYPAINGASVLSVIVWANARKDDGGTRTIQGSIKSGGTVGTTGTDVPLGTNYQYQMLQSLTDPNTGAAWTLPAVNAAEFGIKVTS